jgi:hypothetical protein
LEDYAVTRRIAPSAALETAIEELLAEGLGDGEQLAEIGRLGAVPGARALRRALLRTGGACG